MFWIILIYLVGAAVACCLCGYKQEREDVVAFVLLWFVVVALVIVYWTFRGPYKLGEWIDIQIRSRNRSGRNP